MSALVNNNGHLERSEQVALGLDNRAFLYGDSLFETIKVTNGKVLFWADHFQRLMRGASLLQYDLPTDFKENQLQEQILALVQENALSTARVRLQLFRNAGGRYLPTDNSTSFLISAEKWDIPRYQVNEKGLHVGIYPAGKKDNHPLANFKTGSALIYILAALHAKKNGWDDALILNHEGRIMEATASNIFLVKGTHIHTPPLNDGPVAGILRKQVFSLALEAGYGISSGPVTEENLQAADELWLTNTMQGIRWVEKYGSKTYQAAVASRFCKLLEDFSQKSS
ncbi:MAG: aminotransferase class IV [Chitinophagales bacterium]|nr:aminotransferase class IV [Chitinophagales bacterium]